MVPSENYEEGSFQLHWFSSSEEATLEIHFSRRALIWKMLQRYIFSRCLLGYFCMIWVKEIKATWAASGSTPWGRPLPLARAAKLLDATLPEKVGETQELLAEDYQWDLQPPLRSQPPGQELCTCEVFVPHIWQGAWGWTISEYYLKYNAHHLWCHGKSFTGFFFVAMKMFW